MTAGEATEDEAEVELASIAAIFPELVLDPENTRKATLDLEITPGRPLQVNFWALPDINALQIHGDGAPPPGDLAPQVRAIVLTHLPPFRLSIELPQGYPDDQPPKLQLATDLDWLPHTELPRLQDAGKTLWEEYGQSQVVYAYIDYLQTEIERGFTFEDGTLRLDESLEQPLLAFDKRMKRAKFKAKTYDCGVCLYPKRGSACYQLQRCGHVFCIECLTDCYNTAIKEGDVTIVKCMDPSCGRKEGNRRKKKSLHPTELLDIPLEKATVQRFVELKLKKMLESDKCTVYCPRKWCQAPARSAKYARFNTRDLASWPESDEDEPNAQANGGASALQHETSNANTERLTICSNERCQLAFCSTCQRSWHGDFVNCLSKEAQEKFSEEEKASYDYIRLHTSPCPTCNAACQKIMGCNHMICFQCNTHYCYLCSSWLPEANPYLHFNTRDQPCFMRLWDLEEGDNGEEAQVFGGPRAAEAQAMAAARLEEAQVAEVVAAQAVPVEPAPAPPAPAQALDPPPAARRAQGPPAVEEPARVQVDDFNRQGLARFLELAANDEEEGWESDELEVAEHDTDEWS